MQRTKKVETCRICNEPLAEGSHVHLCICKHEYDSHEKDYKLGGVKCTYGDCPCKHFIWSGEDKPRKPTPIHRLAEQLELVVSNDPKMLKELIDLLSSETKETLSHFLDIKGR